MEILPNIFKRNDVFNKFLLKCYSKNKKMTFFNDSKSFITVCYNLHITIFRSVINYNYTILSITIQKTNRIHGSGPIVSNIIMLL